MTAIPILSGISTTEAGDFAQSLPVNLEPVALDTKLSKGFLRSAMGAAPWITGPGTCRGLINWAGTLYAVMGSTLVSYDPLGTATICGDVGNDGLPVALDYGFGRLAINSNAKLYYWDGGTLTQVTDSDLGPVYDMIWMDGYYVTTDQMSIVVTDLADPTAVNPLKYGSAEADPDQIVGLGRLRGELFAFGSNTIESYTNGGGNLFPFQVSAGATIPKGICGRLAKSRFIQSYAFVGGGRNEALGVWVMGSGTADKISTRLVDDFLAAEANPSAIVLETRVARDESRLYVHMTDQTLVYLASASQKVGEPVWYVCVSGLNMDEPYRLRYVTMAYGNTYCGDVASNQIGVVSESIEPIDDDPVAFFSWTHDGETYSVERAGLIGRRGDRVKRIQWRPHLRPNNGYLGLRFRGGNAQPHFGEATGWKFDAGLLYGEARGFILHDVELVGAPGRQSASWAACEARIEALT